MRNLVLLVAIAVAPSIVACGEVVPLDPDAAIDAREVDAVPDPCAAAALSVDDFFLCLSRAVCTVYEDCIGSDTSHINCDDIPINVFGDLQPTAAKVVIADAVAAGRTQWVPTAAKACVDMLTGQGCALFKGNNDVFDLCGALIGSVTNGSLCQNDIECSTPGAQCVQNAGGGTNQCLDYTCRAPVAVPNMCTAGAFCRPQDHCVNKRVGTTDISFCSTGEAGQACDRDDECDAGNFCNGGLNDSTAMGICTAAKAAGQTCKTDAECTGELACVGNFAAINGICRDVRPPNSVCDTNFPYACQGHQNCETTAANTTGTCKPAADLGQACGVINGIPSYCGFFMSCEGGLCREPGAIGDPCTASNFFGGFSNNPNGCNLGLFCDRDLTGQPAGTCRAAQVDGAQCVTSRNCASENCTSMVCAVYPTCDFP